MIVQLMTAAGTVSIPFTTLSTNSSKSSCARSATITIPAAGSDPYLPRIDVSCGDRAILRDGGLTILDGFVASVSTSSDLAAGKTLKIYDRGLQMNNISAAYSFISASPADVVRRVCADFGITVGTLPDTGSYRMTRNFVGVTLYKIIATAYTLAAAATGKQYFLHFEADKFCVSVLERGDDILYLTPGSNLLTASSTVSMEKMINQVAIVDSGGNLVATKNNAESQNTYGTWRQTVRQTDSAAETAEKTLRDYAMPTYTISAQGLGDWRCVAGACVGVQDRQSGLWGIFAIEADTHTIANEVHTMKLTLTMKNLMNEVEAGS